MTKQFRGKLEKMDAYRWRIPESYSPGMRVPGVIYSSEKLLRDVISDNAPEQVANAAWLPGVVRASMAMPDIHWGYGLPIGGVLATDIDAGGVVTPGGVGYDINCGVRLIRTDMPLSKISGSLKGLAEELFRSVPTGVGSTGEIKLDGRNAEDILTGGAKWAVSRGFGWDSDIDRSEENGAMEGADPGHVSKRAFERGYDQTGTLGSGNHFLEVQEVVEIYDEKSAKVFGVEKGLITVMIHTGSRGFGHEICSEYSAKMVGLSAKAGISLPDKQLSCVPVNSEDGKRYLGAMRSAANYAWANRQVITHLVRQAFQRVFGETPISLGMRLVYDVAHNIAKVEKYDMGGKEKKLCVHRKGATRALPPGHKDLPDEYRLTGQPVIIPGDMGRYSFLLAGTEKAEETFYSTCHGAGRLMSRSEAIRTTKGRQIAKELEAKGIYLRYKGRETVHEEVPEAYKDVADVVDVVVGAGISRKVAKMRPLCVVKG
ncbi:MAG: RtcB family protein [Candidatus Omnitrophica bacterium]|nr:RtcB family protein [Candidatus Omnitrophota bacterium]